MQLISPRCPPTPFRSYYERLRERNVRGNAAVGHLASKLITVLFFCLRSEQPYDPARHALALGSATPTRVLRSTSTVNAARESIALDVDDAC
jgi:hypothetical protein